MSQSCATDKQTGMVGRGVRGTEAGELCNFIPSEHRGASSTQTMPPVKVEAKWPKPPSFKISSWLATFCKTLPCLKILLPWTRPNTGDNMGKMKESSAEDKFYMIPHLPTSGGLQRVHRLQNSGTEGLQGGDRGAGTMFQLGKGRVQTSAAHVLSMVRGAVLCTAV